ncbi:hypothetical protein [Mesorhizobium sp.]|uniref:hypothetical protein n=1 Tax=Mesorhizobium sp. TaxID=1871066 RepID=UPI001201AE98|nr:hypothetical protein [Mesorhizobium sp.]TIN76790.1 MAG: hypothetical protein E5Y09_21100 [Mesorhizobium sp.]
MPGMRLGLGLGLQRGGASGAPLPPDSDDLLLSSIDELDAPSRLLLSGDQQSGTDKLQLSGDQG